MDVPFLACPSGAAIPPIAGLFPRAEALFNLAAQFLRIDADQKFPIGALPDLHVDGQGRSEAA